MQQSTAFGNRGTEEAPESRPVAPVQDRHARRVLRRREKWSLQYLTFGVEAHYILHHQHRTPLDFPKPSAPDHDSARCTNRN